MTSSVKVIHPIAPPSPGKLRVAAYCRVSSDSDDQQNSFLAQVEHYTSLIGENPAWELADIYADEGITGTRVDRRPEFQRLLRDCKNGKVDRILTKSISRFSRNTRDCLESVRELRLLGVSVHFAKEDIDTAALSDEMMLSIFASLAQEESMSISGNMRWSYQRRMRTGEFITCSPAYGYRLVDGSLVVDEAKAVIVKRIFSDYLAGKGVSEIAAELTAEGVPTKSGDAAWDHVSVSKILRNEKYMGDALVQKTYSTDTLPFRRVKNSGQKDRYYISNTHAPIISIADYEQANELLKRRLDQRMSGRPVVNPLNKKIRCGECGALFRYKRRRGGAVYWVCREHDQNKSRCGCVQIPEPEIHAAFMRMWAKLKLNRQYILLPLLDGLMALNSKDAARDAGVVEIDRQINLLNEQNHALNRLRSKGYMDSAFFMEQSNQLAAQASALRLKRKSLLRCDADDQSMAITDVKRLIVIASDTSLPAADFDSDLLGRIVEKITASAQDKLIFQLIGGLELAEPIQRSVR